MSPAFTISLNGYYENRAHLLLGSWKTEYYGYPYSSTIGRIGMRVYQYIEDISSSSIPCIGGQNIMIQLQGHITNHQDLQQQWNLWEDTTIEECIQEMYVQQGIERTLQQLEGSFAIMILDQRVELDHAHMYIATDKYGHCPLYYVQQQTPSYLQPSYEDGCGRTKFGRISTCSEVTECWNQHDRYVISTLSLPMTNDTNIIVVEPGTYREFTLSRKVHSQWKITWTNKQVYACFSKTNSSKAS
jgi:asparagine synthetase B (glutamine-hydrolysing)